MTRRSITTVLGSLLIGLLLTVNAPAVSAGGACTSGYAPEHCETMMVSQGATLIPPPSDDPTGTTVSSYSMGAWRHSLDDQASLVAPLVHILDGNGLGQEHFEAMEGNGYGAFVVAAPMNAAVHSASGYAPENYEQMTLVAVASN